LSFEPPYKLDPYEAVRNPMGLPVLLQRGIYDVIEKQGAEGSLHDRVVKAFNFVAKTLTDSKRIREGTLELTAGVGSKREKEVLHLSDTKMKQRWLVKWTAQLKKQFPGRYDNSWWTDPLRGITPSIKASPKG
jgi:hypothetical protein